MPIPENSSADFPLAEESTTELDALDVEPGSPESYGFFRSVTPREKAAVWDRQEAFLAAYRETGRINKAAEAVGMSRQAPVHWQNGDVFGFRERIKDAHRDWCEAKIEGLIDERLANPQGNRGSDILLMFQAKAEMPEKYREEVKIIDTGSTKDLLAELRKQGRPRIVEGTATPIDDPSPPTLPEPPKPNDSASE